MVHNEYQRRGGEERVFASEAALLETHGHEVIRYVRSNAEVAETGRLTLARDTIWNPRTHREMEDLVRRERPDVVHVHNTFPLISPSVFYAISGHEIPVVMTLHNYRLVCPNGLFFRDERPCEDCLGRVVPWPGVLHSCYRDSRATTGVVAAMLSSHRLLGTWRRKVSAFVALTQFARERLVSGGLPEGKVHVKPNFVDPDPGPGEGTGGYALFVGRLSQEKGIETLLSAWERPELQGVNLKIIGDGPLADLVERYARRLPNVEWLGERSSEDVRLAMKGALAQVFPSEWYETFGLVAAEAFATGTPVIGARIGAVAELVDDGRTGLLFEPGDAAGLASKVSHLFENPGERARMRQAARKEYEARYTAGENYKRLMEIYATVTQSAAVPA